MTIAIIIGSFLIIVVIILLSQKSPTKAKGREQFLKEFSAFIDGTIQPIEGRDGFAVSFAFEGSNFIFEDVQEAGFGEDFNKAYLRIQSNSDLSLTFTEKEKAGSIRGNIMMVSDIPDKMIEDDVKVNLPKGLDHYAAHANSASKANTLLNDAKALKLFKLYSNSDRRGYPYLALNIKNGAIVLEFRAVANYRPSLLDLHNNIHSLEKILDQMVFLRNLIDSIELNS